MTQDAADWCPRGCCKRPADAAAASFVPSVGDRVRIVLEGRVRPTTEEGRFLVGEADDNGNLIAPSAAHVVSVEKLEAAQPEWLAGDVVRCGKGDTWFRIRGDQWVGGSGRSHPDHHDRCPLTLLVRGGETVATTSLADLQGKCEQ